MDEQTKIKILEMAIQIAIARLNNPTEQDKGMTATQLRNEIGKNYTRLINILQNKEDEK